MSTTKSAAKRRRTILPSAKEGTVPRGAARAVVIAVKEGRDPRAAYLAYLEKHPTQRARVRAAS